MTQTEFVSALGTIFEETPSIAEQAWHQRPFRSVEGLWQAMVDIVKADSAAAQLALIKAHPDLGSRASMADASVQEQAGAGLSQMSERNYDRFQQLNDAYKQKFGFPFVMAVKGYQVEDILQAFEDRLDNDEDRERTRSLFEIFQIARFRLEDCIN
ncbi:2-oxo-4-hydroxy-4-carboxy-5-ureidoimidazoline decarboxylase [cf. Phormidesmis sp. LEGE 11477]|nr:2-oxo-4-hydroxy-4-carboxy-5-ureidoimidazoline decarboxylase [cf. Phormidesmis sp. LEGE 11477]